MPSPLVSLCLAFALAPFAAACGDSARSAQPTSTARAPSTPAGPITLSIVSPADGETVTNPFAVRLQVTGVQIAAASEQVPGGAHFHAFVDKEPVAEGEVVPSGPDVFHFTQQAIEFQEAPGEHTVTVVLGDNAHVRLMGAPAATVKVNVSE